MRFGVAGDDHFATRPTVAAALEFLGSPLPPVSPTAAWTAAEYAHVHACAAWAVPRLLRRLPVRTLLRALAGVLAEMQIVVISESPAVAASAVLGLAALARPLLWVGRAFAASPGTFAVPPL